MPSSDINICYVRMHCLFVLCYVCMFAVCPKREKEREREKQSRERERGASDFLIVRSFRFGRRGGEPNNSQCKSVQLLLFAVRMLLVWGVTSLTEPKSRASSYTYSFSVRALTSGRG